MIPSAGDYSRIYHSIIDDPRFVTVMGDDAAGWTWVKLLIGAEQAWPASAFLPRWVKRRPLAVLVDAGIVELDVDKYRIHGLDPERQRRHDHAKDAAGKRWGRLSTPPGTAPGNAPGTAQPMLDETSRDEQRRDEQSRTPGHDPIDAYFVRTTHVPRKGALTWLNRLAAEYGDPLLCEAIAATDADPPTDYLSRVEMRLAHVLEGAKAAPPNGRHAPTLTPEQDAEARRMVAEQTGVTPESIAAGRAAMAALPRGRTRTLSRIGGEA